MADEGTPTGELFSRVYLERGEPQLDSTRFRARLAAQVAATSFNRSDTAHLILRELGVAVSSSGQYPRIRYHFDSFINNSKPRDLLDTITIIYRAISASDIVNARNEFRSFVERAMREENLRYRVDGLCGVHFYFDEEFEKLRVSTLNGLSKPQHQAAREAFEDAHSALLASDTLSAVRRSFDAVENVFKVRFGVPRLGASEIKSKLQPTLSAIYTGRILDAANRLATAFAEWTNAGHQFRHAPGEADPSPPPLEMAILIVSEAAAHLRWLIGLPQASVTV